MLLVRWDEDDLNVKWEVEGLERVFRDLYGFSTEIFFIPTQDSHLSLMGKALSFVAAHNDGDSLLVVYYGGHAMINKARQATWSW